MALKTPDRYLAEIRARSLRIFYRGERFGESWRRCAAICRISGFSRTRR